jgi:chromosome segregation ATPase
MADGKLGLGAAAAALEAELRRFEQLAELASRVELKSQRSLERAARAAQDAVQAQQRVGDRVRDLVEEIARARERQEEQTKGLGARAEQIHARQQALNALLERFARLGEGAAEVNALLKDAGRIAEAEERLAKLAEDAETLLRDAEREGFEDAVRQAESIRQQSLAARNKLKLVREKK